MEQLRFNERNHLCQPGRSSRPGWLTHHCILRALGLQGASPSTGKHHQDAQVQRGQCDNDDHSDVINHHAFDDLVNHDEFVNHDDDHKEELGR